MSKFVFLFLNLFLLGEFSMASKFDQAHSDWSGVLKNYQNPKGNLNYKKLKQDIQTNKFHPFKKYIADIQEVKLSEYETFSREEKMAFLINAYNALTVELVLIHYPVKSIKKIGGFFKKPWSIEFFSLLDGKIKSLDPIEHVWLRPHFKDYRIHAAVNCASISCPALRHEAFVAKNLQAQLDDQMKMWLTDQNKNQIQISKKIWNLSKIFDWYEEDFDKWGGGVQSVVSKHLNFLENRAVASEIKIKYLDYDWSLNEVQ